MTPAEQVADPQPSSTAGELTDLPLLRHERIWGFWKFTSVNVGMAMATWSLLTGGTVALFVGAKTAVVATVLGNLIGVALVALATCVPSGKYGVEQFTALRSVFGVNGVRALLAVLMPVAAAGWNAVLAVMFGRAVTNVVNSIFGTDHDPNGPMVVAMSLLALVLAWLTLARGPVSIERVNRIVVPVLAVLTVVMLILLLRQHSWTALSEAQPVSAFPDQQLNFAVAVELSFATGFSWWTIMGNLGRLTTGPRAAFWPNMIGLFAAAVLASLIGTLSALALGQVDPTVWMIPLGGAVLGVLALLFIAFANVTAIISQTYSGGLALIRAGGSPVRRIPWPLFVALTLVPAAIVVFWPAALYDNFFKFISLIGMVMAPLTAVYLVDFFLLRKRKLNLRELYLPEGTSRYSFWWGVNPAPFLAVAAGVVTYFLLLNPVTFESAAAFTYISASLPAFAVTALVHTMLTVLWVIPAGKGGYR